MDSFTWWWIDFPNFTAWRSTRRARLSPRPSLLGGYRTHSLHVPSHATVPCQIDAAGTRGSARRSERRRASRRCASGSAAARGTTPRWRPRRRGSARTIGSQRAHRRCAAAARRPPGRRACRSGAGGRGASSASSEWVCAEQGTAVQLQGAVQIGRHLLIVGRQRLGHGLLEHPGVHPAAGGIQRHAPGLEADRARGSAGSIAIDGSSRPAHERPRPRWLPATAPRTAGRPRGRAIRPRPGPSAAPESASEPDPPAGAQDPAGGDFEPAEGVDAYPRAAFVDFHLASPTSFADGARLLAPGPLSPQGARKRF